MRRVLLIPSDHGGGRGHVSRCLYLADLINMHNNKAAIVLEAKHFNSISSDKIKTFLLDTSMERIVKYQLKKPFKPAIRLKSRVLKRPVFLEFDSLAYQVPRDGYWTPKLVTYRFKKLCRIIENFKPHVLIGDTHFLTYLCGKKFNIPVIQITRLAGFPLQPQFLWWNKKELDIKAPDVLQPFIELLDNLNISWITKTEDLLSGQSYIIPAVAEVEPIDMPDKNIIFSGALAQDTTPNHYTPFYTENDKPKIYISIGGGAGRSKEKQFFDSILSIFSGQDYHVLVSTGNRIDAKLYRNRSKNVIFENWVHGPSAIFKSDLVIYHGGYGTTLEVLTYSKPSIVLPSHTEQEGNGRRLEALKVGKMILFSKERKKLEFSWPYGNYSMNAGFDFNLDQDTILQSIDNLLKEQHENSNILANKLAIAKNEFNISQIINTI